MMKHSTTLLPIFLEEDSFHISLNKNGKSTSEIPEFSDSLNPEDFVDWVNQVERIFEYHDVPDHKKVTLVAIKLKGRASAWWEQLQMQRVELERQ